MAAPIYTQEEVSRLIAMPKWIAQDDWKQPQPEDERSHWLKVRLECHPPEEVVESMRFEVELVRNELTDEYFMSLYAQILPKPLLPILRLDLQRTVHRNPVGSVPPEVAANVPHKHLYRVTDVEALDNWDAYGEPVDIAVTGSPQQRWRRLLRRFMEDVSLEILDPETHSTLFGPEF